ncbi:MAG: L-dopachrome tautomerase-related protein [Janthinobacterium lividum]
MTRPHPIGLPHVFVTSPGAAAPVERRRVALAILLLGIILSTSAAAADFPASSVSTADPVPNNHLVLRAQSKQMVWNGVAVAPDGRMFAVFPRAANTTSPSLALVAADGSLTPYPDAAWNANPPTDPKRLAAGSMPASGPGSVFVGLNAIHLAPDNALWAVDTGSPGFGKPASADATRLIRIDLATNQVTRVLTLPQEVLRPKSMIDDIRFNGGHAYISDAGAPGLIVLELASGSFRRVLDHDPALTAQRSILVDGDVVKGPDGKPAMIHADQLEVTPDGRYLYIQPLSGPMSRVATALLDDPQTSPQMLSHGTAFWYDTPALGGTAIAPDGTLYLNDVETDSILSLSPDRKLTRLIHDPRLHWADASFLAPDGTLMVPVPQLDRAPPFHRGHSQIQFPVSLYTLKPSELAADAAKAEARPAVPAPTAPLLPATSSEPGTAQPPLRKPAKIPS